MREYQITWAISPFFFAFDVEILSESGLHIVHGSSRRSWLFEKFVNAICALTFNVKDNDCKCMEFNFYTEVKKAFDTVIHHIVYNILDVWMYFIPGLSLPFVSLRHISSFLRCCELCPLKNVSENSKQNDKHEKKHFFLYRMCIVYCLFGSVRDVMFMLDACQKFARIALQLIALGEKILPVPCHKCFAFIPSLLCRKANACRIKMGKFLHFEMKNLD